mmetsp:Transcript_38168/g.80316  ORF Transcript_38168/g.80316 Transcript_38168/m.80316 type:complete len:209 (+) Transcript_38168:329-955(+)
MLLLLDVQPVRILVRYLVRLLGEMKVPRADLLARIIERREPLAALHGPQGGVLGAVLVHEEELHLAVLVEALEVLLVQLSRELGLVEDPGVERRGGGVRAHVFRVRFVSALGHAAIVNVLGFGIRPRRAPRGEKDQHVGVQPAGEGDGVVEHLVRVGEHDDLARHGVAQRVPEHLVVRRLVERHADAGDVGEGIFLPRSRRLVVAVDN